MMKRWVNRRGTSSPNTSEKKPQEQRNLEGISQSELTNLLNRYSSNNTLRDARDILQKNISGVEWPTVKWADIHTYQAWFYLMERDKMILSNEMNEKRITYTNLLRSKYPPIKKEPVKKDDWVMPELWKDRPDVAAVDDYVDRFHEKHDKKIAEELKSHIGKMNRDEVRDYPLRTFKNLYDEISLVGKDKDVTEAFVDNDKLKKYEIVLRLNFYRDMWRHCEFVLQAAKQARAPRKKKPVSIEKKMKHIQFLQLSKELSLVSIKPESILRSNVLWCFNAKTRDLILYRSAGGFDIKGTTLLNGDSATCKRIRKPELVSSMIAGTPAKVMKEWAQIQGREKKTNYRINKDTLILKAVVST